MPRDVYDSLRGLDDSICELLSELEIKIKIDKIKLPSRFIQILQSIANGGILAEHMVGMSVEIRNAVNAAKALRIDSWSLKENADILEKALAEKSETIENLSNKVNELEKELSSIDKANEEYKTSVIQKHEVENNKTVSAQDMQLITGLIALRDNQAIRRDFLIGQGEDQDSPGIKLIGSILKETALLMEKNGVEILEDKGEFSSDRQMAVDTVKTDDPALADHIASIVRPGYIYKGSLIRPEEVVVYITEEN